MGKTARLNSSSTINSIPHFPRRYRVLSNSHSFRDSLQQTSRLLLRETASSTKTSATQERRDHDRMPLRSWRSPPARTPGHAILSLLPIHVLSSLKPDTFKPIGQDAVYRALTPLPPWKFAFRGCGESNRPPFPNQVSRQGAGAEGKLMNVKGPSSPRLARDP